MNDQVEGEKVSAHLIGMQSQKKSKKMITSLIKRSESNINSQNDQFINTKDEINLYVSESFKDLYDEKNCDIDMQNFFLSQIQSNITDSENEDLVKYVDEEEIYSIIKNMNLNKSPGIDGIPLEFFYILLGYY